MIMTYEKLLCFLNENNLESLESLERISSSLHSIIQTRGSDLSQKRYRYGVCDVVGWTVPRELSTEWKYFSGDSLYPVCDDTLEITPCEQFHNVSISLWEGRQLSLRLSLCEHLYTKINRIIEVLQARDLPSSFTI